MSKFAVRVIVASPPVLVTLAAQKSNSQLKKGRLSMAEERRPASGQRDEMNHNGVTEEV